MKKISDILNIHESHPPRIFGLLYFHCFNICKHISISVMFFIISVSCFVFCRIFENNCPGGGILARLFGPRGSRFRTFFVPGGGAFALSKNSPGMPGGMVRLGID